MPTYDYRCKACDHEFELFQSMTAPVKKKCPECNKISLERLIGTGAAVIFKGSGFYETDYRSKSYKDAAKKDKEAAKPPAAGAEAKASSKGDGSGKTDTMDTSSKPAGGSKKSSE